MNDGIKEDKQRQSDKEKAARLALSRGLALIRRGKSVYGLSSDGTETFISRSRKYEDIWHDALGALQKKPTPPAETDGCESEDCLTIYTDGGSRGNPGPSASAYVIYDTDGNVVEEGGSYLGITTNNQAEYQAVKMALEAATKHTSAEVNFRIDSELVVKQMNGEYKVKNKDLWPVHQAIRDLEKHFEKVTFTHIYRKENSLADQQVNVILDRESN